MPKEEQTKEKEVVGSGPTALEMKEGKQTLDLPPGLEAVMQTFFGRIAPDAKPGWNTLTITGLPIGTRAVSAWMTEWILPNNPHAGSAWFTTNSVQLYANGTQCRVRFHLDWGGSLPAAVQMIYSP
jgi:hypothetical protein